MEAVIPVTPNPTEGEKRSQTSEINAYIMAGRTGRRKEIPEKTTAGTIWE
jgi:hypothetical protein